MPYFTFYITQQISSQHMPTTNVHSTIIVGVLIEEIHQTYKQSFTSSCLASNDFLLIFGICIQFLPNRPQTKFYILMATNDGVKLLYHHYHFTEKCDSKWNNSTKDNSFKPFSSFVQKQALSNLNRTRHYYYHAKYVCLNL